MPLWTLEGLRSADPMLGLALVMLLAVVAADSLNRLVGLPRPTGLMLVGALASPFAFDLIETRELNPWKPIIDLAIGALVFELGSRIRPRWLIDNRWLALGCVLEGLLAGLAVVAALVLLGAAPMSAALAGAVAMSTSPVISMTMVHDLRPRGQVAERVLLASAVNSVLAMLALNAWRVVAAVGLSSPGSEWLTVSAGAVYVVCGSFLLGVATAYALHRLTQRSDIPSAMPVLQIALVILATLLAAQWKLSPLLALLVAGVAARRTMGHRLTVEPHLGSAGAVLSVLLFISLGVLFAVESAPGLWTWALAVIAARFAGKALATAVMARVSGLGWRQALALTLALQPMSSLAILLATDSFDWQALLPGVDTPVLQALLLATTVMQLAGPLLTQAALHTVAAECESPRRGR